MPLNFDWIYWHWNVYFHSLIFSGSIRENIIFGSNYIQERYDKVIDDCALRDDFLEINGGDSIEIGGAGAILSGGQMQRLSIGIQLKWSMSRW